MTNRKNSRTKAAINTHAHFSKQQYKAVNAFYSACGIASKRGKLNKNALPSPLDYLAREGIEIKGAGLWRVTHCVFHDDKHASLSINTDTGAFKCHACDARGGDVLAFHMQRHSMPFKEAAQALGAWDVSYE